MGITTSLGFLKSSLSVSGIVLHGWPVIALLYPLFVSIMAVSNDSKEQMRKLVKYWTLFSLFSLFEFAFVKINEWIPHWSSVRLVLVCCLVMPQFEGACLAYQGLARIFLLVKRLCKRETFLNSEENNIEENGSEALQRRIALEHESQKCIGLQRDTKIIEQEGDNSAETPNQHESQKHIDLQRDAQNIEQEGENSAAISKQLESQKCIDLQIDTKIIEQEGKSSATTSKQIRSEHSISSAQVLNGTCAITNVKEATPPKASAENRHPETIPLEKTQQDEQSISSAQVMNGTCAITKEMTPPEASAKNRRPETTPLEKTQQEWTCDLCKVTNASRSMLNAHVQGSKHKSKLESLKASVLDAIDTGPSPLVQHAQSVSVARDLMGTFAAAEFKDIMPPNEAAEKRCPETPLLKKAQQEWTTTSEITSNDHLQGRKHMSTLGAKDKGPSPSATIKQKDGNVAEKLIKDSGSEGKLIASKIGRGECSNFHGDVQVVELKEKNGPAASQQVQHAQSVSAARDLKGTDAPAVVKGIMQPKEMAELRRPKAPLLEKAQKEWTCVLCKVTTTSEITFNDHLRGRKHMSKLGAKDKGPSPLATIKLKDDSVAEKHIKYSGSEGKLIASKTKPGERSNSHGDVQVVESKEKNGPTASQKYANAEVKETKPPKAQQERRHDLYKVRGTSEDMSNAQLRGSKQNSKFESLKTSKDGTFPKWCTVCDVKLLSEDNVATHFNGKKHKSNLKLSQKDGET